MMIIIMIIIIMIMLEVATLVIPFTTVVSKSLLMLIHLMKY